VTIIAKVLSFIYSCGSVVVNTTSCNTWLSDLWKVGGFSRGAKMTDSGGMF